MSDRCLLSLAQTFLGERERGALAVSIQDKNSAVPWPGWNLAMESLVYSEVPWAWILPQAEDLLHSKDVVRE